VVCRSDRHESGVGRPAIHSGWPSRDASAARAQWRQVADQVRPKLPRLAALLDEAEEDVLTFMAFPKEHRAKIHSTNPLERVNGEIKRRTEVVGIFPNEAAITRLVGAILLEQNDEWTVQRARYMTRETIAPLRMISPSCCPPRPHEPGRPDLPSRSRPPNSDTTPRDTTDDASLAGCEARLRGGLRLRLTGKSRGKNAQLLVCFVYVPPPR
jgi:hypothetical protein